MGKKMFNKVFLFLIFALVLSCKKPTKDLNALKTIDNIFKTDYQKIRDKVLPDDEPVLPLTPEEPMIPQMTPVTSNPVAPDVTKDKFVSISINEDVPLKEVFVELSRLANIDIEIDPNIRGGVILRARNKPFREVIDRICDLSNLRYSMKNGILRIENDTPFLVNYVLDFLNITRSNSGSTSLSTAIVGGASGSGGGSSASGGSTSDIKATYESDLWKAIQSDINKIIGVEDSSASSTSSASPPTSAEATSQVKSSSTTSNYIAANPQAGIVGIFASNKQHQTIKSYLEKIKDTVSAQVLIEAKIVEIDLSDQYRSGVNWSSLMKKIRGGLAISQSLTFPKSSNAGTDSLTVLSPRGATSSPFSNGAAGVQGSSSPGSLDTLVQLSQQFGVTRTLSSPRLHAMNNQQAVLSFVTNQVYFSVSIESQADTTTSTGGTTKGTLSVNSTSHTIPIGVILTLQPSINLDTEEITMNIRPTITNTDLDNGILDPAIEYIKTTVPDGTNTNALFSKIPVVDVKELDSILKIKSGEIMVIGGMMQDRTSDVHSGIPGLMSIPLLGNLFKTVNKINTTTQTVIFIQATIVPSNELSKKDRNFYNNFAIDKEVRI